jgi:hypothetical protein
MIGYGDTFMFADEDDSDAHLHIIITPPTQLNEVIVASITTHRKRSDTTTCFQGGEHERITHPSVVFFRKARVITISAIEALIKNHDAAKKTPLEERHLKRCRAGLIESDQTTNEVRQFFLEHYDKLDEN